MILSTNLSPALMQLIATEAVPIDAIEVGPWFTVEEIRQYQEKLPGWKFYFHPSSWTSRMALSAKSMRRLNTYLSITRSPWASIHISLLPPGYVKLAMRFGLYLPPPPASYAVNRFIQQIKKLKAGIDVPVILENMPSFPTGKYLFESETSLINRILEETDCKFLLDLSHARVAAAVQGIPVHDYLVQLPLEKVIQIHVSGPRVRNGVLFDAHEPLEAEDYALLTWVLARTKPQVLTLEYFKDRDNLREQLSRLANMME